MPKTPPGETRARIGEFVCQRILLGTPPSVREVQEAFGFKSTATVRQHLDALVDAGVLAREAGKDRGYRIPGAFVPAMVPVLGRVQAGALMEAIESVEAYIPLSAELAETSFALIVRGESMAGREIHDGDTVVVQRGAQIKAGDVVVALIGDEATVKTFHQDSGQIVLKAANPDYADIVPDPGDESFVIIGRVFEVRRQL